MTCRSRRGGGTRTSSSKSLDASLAQGTMAPMAGLDGLAISWLRLRQMWLSSHASEEPLAPPNEAIASAEKAIRAKLVDLLNSTPEDATRLLAFARDIRDKHVGPRIDLRAA